MTINDFTRYRARLLTLLALISSGCCGPDIVDQQVDRSSIDGVYQVSSPSELSVIVPAFPNTGDPQTKTVVATDVSVTVEGSVVRLDFVAENQKYSYTYNMQETARVTVTSP